MDRLVEAALAANPEIRLAVGAEARSRAVIVGLPHFHHQDVTQRRKSLLIECFRLPAIRDREADVVKHDTQPPLTPRSITYDAQRACA
jgi:hypothetical protein